MQTTPHDSPGILHRFRKK